MGLDSATIGQFNINKGVGTGGFQFKTYNSNGTLAFTNMSLRSNGQVQAVYYNKTSDTAADFEAVAIAGFDADGNLVRDYQSNVRFRTIESRLTAIEDESSGVLEVKINEIVTRLNGLNFFSNNIAKLPTIPARPTNVAGTVSSVTSVTVTFTGDNEATSYTIKASTGGSVAKTVTGVLSSPYTVTGLTTGTVYTFTVSATNSQGTSAESSPSSGVTTTVPVDIIYNMFNNGPSYMFNGGVWKFTNKKNAPGQIRIEVSGTILPLQSVSGTNITTTLTSNPTGLAINVPANGTFTITWNLDINGDYTGNGVFFRNFGGADGDGDFSRDVFFGIDDITRNFQQPVQPEEVVGYTFSIFLN
jgi:hypothetical protein